MKTHNLTLTSANLALAVAALVATARDLRTGADALAMEVATGARPNTRATAAEVLKMSRTARQMQTLANNLLGGSLDAEEAA